MNEPELVADMGRIFADHQKMHERFRSVPREGRLIPYLGKEFIVYPGIFWPMEDSMPLVENYVVHEGEDVLDVCAGSGVIAVHSALKAAKRVVALDINPEAIRTIRENAKRHGVADIVEARLSDVLEALDPSEMFDVVTGNLPFYNHPARDFAEKTTWDEDLKTHQRFFSGILRHLKNPGRIYLAQSSLGAYQDMLELARTAGFGAQLIGQKNTTEPKRTFYAYLLQRTA